MSNTCLSPAARRAIALRLRREDREAAKRQRRLQRVLQLRRRGRQ